MHTKNFFEQFQKLTPVLVKKLKFVNNFFSSLFKNWAVGLS